MSEQMFLRRAINQSCWLELAWSMYRRAVRQAAKFRNKNDWDRSLSSTTWSVTWPSIFGEGHICWVPGQWKERTATPGHVFVSDSSVTVGLNSVLKLYLKRRLDCDGGNAVSCTPLHVCMFVYIGDLESQNIRLFWVNSDFFLPIRYHQNLLNTSSSQILSSLL